MIKCACPQNIDTDGWEKKRREKKVPSRGYLVYQAPRETAANGDIHDEVETRVEGSREGVVCFARARPRVPVTPVAIQDSIDVPP